MIPLSTKIHSTLLLTLGLVAPAMAQDLVQFQNGQVADANAVNSNFNALKSDVDAASASVNSLADSVNALTSALSVDANTLTANRNLRLSGFSELQLGESTFNGDPIRVLRESGVFDESVLKFVIGDGIGGQTDRLDVQFGSTVAFIFNQAGAALKINGTSWTALSDARLKHDIEPLTGSLDRLARLRGVTFEYNDPTVPGTAPGRQTGFIAQEVQRVFPEWVREEHDGMLSLTISGFEALTVESLQELAARNADLAQRSEQLAAENDDLRRRLDALRVEVDQNRALVAQNLELHQRLGAIEAAVAHLQPAAPK